MQQRQAHVPREILPGLVTGRSARSKRLPEPLVFELAVDKLAIEPTLCDTATRNLLLLQ
jgi:hypothetical protein